MRFNEMGEYVPQLKAKKQWGQWSEDGLRICPFGINTENEDTLGKALYSGHNAIHHRSEIGYYLTLYAGYVRNKTERLASTSGGIIIWIANMLLKEKLVDAIVCVGALNEGDGLFGYRYITDIEELSGCRKSRYYPVEMSKVIQQILIQDQRVAFIGLPCFIKAIRLAMQENTLLAERVRFCVGLVCGHLKSKYYMNYLARHAGVEEESAILRADFRKKVEGCPANDYAFEVIERSEGKESAKSVSMKDVWAGNWGYNLFMLKACEYCDDVLAETADVTVGDAWLKEYVQDSCGTSIVITRRHEIEQLLQMGIDNNEIHLESLTVDQVVKSQDAGLRQRRQALSFRLFCDQKNRMWHPAKRRQPDKHSLDFFDRLVQRMRIRIRAKSHLAFNKQRKSAGLALFKKEMRFLIGCYQWIYKVKLPINRLCKLFKNQKRLSL